MENTFGINIIPQNDQERIQALKRYRILDTPPEGAFDNVARLATQIFKVPISLISLVDAEQVYFKANIGMGKARVSSRGVSLCSLAILKQEVTVFENAPAEPCLLVNPNVAGEFGLKFYAGAPLTTHDGFRIGTLCILDKSARKFSKDDEALLEGLAKIVMDELELRLSAITEADRQQQSSDELTAINEEMTAINEEIRAANDELLHSRDHLLKLNNELQESERKFRDLVSQAPVAITLYHAPELIIEQSNEAMLKLWGRGEDIIGQPLLKARPELKGHPYMDIIRNVIVSGVTHTGEAVKGPVLRNGAVMEGYFDVTYKPLKDHAGEVTGVMVVATDVTEKTLSRQREMDLNNELAAINEELAASNEELTSSQEHLLNVNHSLSESESRFRNLIQQSPVAIASLKGRELFIDCANPMILKIWGKDASVVGKPLKIALPELEGQQFLQILDDVYTSGKAFYGSEAKVTLEQEGKLTELFVNFVYQPIYDKNGLTTEIMVAANDVTEQVLSRLVLKEKNDALSLLAEQLAYVSNAIPQQVWTATPDGLLDFVNLQTEQYFDMPAAELVGENWIKVVHPDDLGAAGKAWMHSLTTGDPYQTEFRLLSKDGVYLWHLARATPFIEEGKVVKWFGTNTDIDGHKQLEQHKTDFISIASHELKTPLTSLKASLQLLNRIKDEPATPILPKLIEQSARGVQKISGLVDDLLSVTRMNEGQMQLNKTVFVAEDLLGLCCNHITIEGKYEVVIDGELKLVLFADEHLIEQVMVNLTNNAIKYAPESKTVLFYIEKQGEMAKISVIDKGPGIPAVKQPYLFDRYYRADHSGQQYSGLGLGLFICSEIVKRHGGQIGVESEPGKGSNFGLPCRWQMIKSDKCLLMKISKSKALFYLIVNCIMLIYGAGRFFYFGETVIKDFNRVTPVLPPLNYVLLNAVSGICTIIIFIGIYWMFKLFNESKWVKSGLIVFFACRIIGVLTIPALILIHGEPYRAAMISTSLSNLGLGYLLFTFLFVKERAIRKYFWCFTSLMVLCLFLVYEGPAMYDNYGYNWLLINNNLLANLPFVATLVLFVEIFNLSRKPIEQPMIEPDADEQTQRPDYSI